MATTSIIQSLNQEYYDATSNGTANTKVLGSEIFSPGATNIVNDWPQIASNRNGIEVFINSDTTDILFGQAVCFDSNNTTSNDIGGATSKIRILDATDSKFTAYAGQFVGPADSSDSGPVPLSVKPGGRALVVIKGAAPCTITTPGVGGEELTVSTNAGEVEVYGGASQGGFRVIGYAGLSANTMIVIPTWS